MIIQKTVASTANPNFWILDTLVVSDGLMDNRNPGKTRPQGMVLEPDFCNPTPSNSDVLIIWVAETRHFWYPNPGNDNRMHHYLITN